MAWTKCNHGLWFSPEVLGLAARLNIDPIHVGGCCMRIWSWADVEAKDGIIRGATPGMADALVRLPGFAEAMASVKWLSIEKNGLRFPNWDRHNSQSAKERAMDQARHWRIRHNRDNTGTTPGHFPNKTRQTRQTRQTPPYPPVGGEQPERDW